MSIRDNYNLISGDVQALPSDAYITCAASTPTPAACPCPRLVACWLPLPPLAARHTGGHYPLSTRRTAAAAPNVTGIRSCLLAAQRSVAVPVAQLMLQIGCMGEECMSCGVLMVCG